MHNMCGRYTIYKIKDLDKRYSLAEKPGFVSKDNYNVAPRQRLPVIYQAGPRRVAELMQWGFLPAFAKDPAKSVRPINTVAETAFSKPMWREAIKHRRCLVPARGFYEWQSLDGRPKQPYYIRPRGLELFSFGGLYSVWRDAEGYPLFSFSIVTTAANRQMAPIHNRMPVILLPETEASWLEPAYDQPEQLADLLVPYSGELEIYKVSPAVNSPRANDDNLIRPLD